MQIYISFPSVPSIYQSCCIYPDFRRVFSFLFSLKHDNCMAISPCTQAIL